jgi:hypothetical protein
VISWAKSQPWYQEPFWLIGHSLGGIVIAKYTFEHPKKIKGLVLASPTISATRLGRKRRERLKEINGEVWYYNISSSTGEQRRLKWTPFIEDLKKYNLVKFISTLKNKILILVGEKESYCKPLTEISQKLSLELNVIKDAPHNYVEEKYLKQIRKTLQNWIQKNI